MTKSPLLPRIQAITLLPTRKSSSIWNLKRSQSQLGNFSLLIMIMAGSFVLWTCCAPEQNSTRLYEQRGRSLLLGEIKKSTGQEKWHKFTLWKDYFYNNSVHQWVIPEGLHCQVKFYIANQLLILFVWCISISEFSLIAHASPWRGGLPLFWFCWFW